MHAPRTRVAACRQALKPHARFLHSVHDVSQVEQIYDQVDGMCIIHARAFKRLLQNQQVNGGSKV